MANTTATSGSDDDPTIIPQMVALCRALETCIELTNGAIVRSSEQALGLYGYIAQQLAALGRSGDAPDVVATSTELAGAHGDLVRTAEILQKTQAASASPAAPPAAAGASAGIDPRKAALDKMYLATAEMMIDLMATTVTTQKTINGITVQIVTGGKQDLDTALQALTAATVKRITEGGTTVAT